MKEIITSPGQEESLGNKFAKKAGQAAVALAVAVATVACGDKEGPVASNDSGYETPENMAEPVPPTETPPATPTMQVEVIAPTEEVKLTEEEKLLPYIDANSPPPNPTQTP